MKWINKHGTSVQYNVQFSLTIKSDEAPMHATTLVNSENVMPSERSQNRV